MKKKHLMILLICTVVIVLIAVLALAAYMNFKYRAPEILAEKEVGIDVTISDINKIGFNADRDALHFGILSSGHTGTRGMNTTNNMDVSVRVKIYVYGNISQWIRLSINDYVLAPGDGQIVHVYLSVPENVKAGNYTGTLKAVYIRE